MKVGLIGWRGMVGSVLISRMKEMGDFEQIEPMFFTTSQAGQEAPDFGQTEDKLLDASDLKKLAECDAIISCQGGSYTEKVYADLRQNWSGFWIDAASTLRMDPSAVIVLDPLNGDLIQKAVADGVKTFVGGNCTVSLLMLGIHGLLKENLVEWVSSMTYQAISGSGAAAMKSLLTQMNQTTTDLNIAESALKLERDFADNIRSIDFDQDAIGSALAGNVLPYIDSEVSNGQSREEWKATVELNKILNRNEMIPVDGTCVRVGAMRSHCQGLTIKLKENISLDSIENCLANANEWVKLVPNKREESLNELTPVSVSGSLDIKVGRVRKMLMGDEYLNVFTLGDQLLWGAAEPLRRMLKLL